jgi:hypothetical protein
MTRLTYLFRQNLKRKRQKRIACQNSRRLIERLMARRQSTPKVIIIHCR